MKNTQRGFIVPLVIIIIAVLAVGGGTYVYTKNKESADVIVDTNIQATTTATVNPPKSTKATSTQTSSNKTSSSSSSLTSPKSSTSKTKSTKTEPTVSNTPLPVANPPEQPVIKGEQVIAGFKVIITDQAIKSASIKKAINQLNLRLEESKRLSPKLAGLASSVTFYVTNAQWRTGMMTYHPSAVWLSENGLDPAMGMGIEIFSIDNFLKWNVAGDQPLAILHELAHAYHHRNLDWDNEGEVSVVFKNASDSGIYNSVRYKIQNGPLQKAYAMTNKYEYFAEISEAYFGTNDFYPFNREQLKSFDPQGYALMQKVYGN
jgi:hypothetical protein